MKYNRSKNKTISRDLAIWLAAIISAISLLFGVIIYVVFTEKTEKDLQIRSKTLAERFSQIVALPVYNYDAVAIKDIIEPYMKTEALISVNILEPSGSPIYETSNEKYGGEKAPVTEKRKINYNNEDLGTVTIALSRDRLRETKNNIIFATLASVLILITSIIFGSIFILRKLLTNPLSNLRDGITTIAEGNYQHQMDEIVQEDINTIIEDVNKMARQILQRDQSLHAEIAMRKDAEEEVNKMNEELEQKVMERTAQLEAVQKELVERAHKAGMADIAADTLHNVGNILNSVKTSAQFINDIASTSQLEGFKKANGLLKENLENIEDFIINSPKGQKLMAYYLKLGKGLDKENTQTLKHANRLRDKVDTIVEVIAAQQSYATFTMTEEYPLCEVIEDALTMHASSIEKYNIKVVKNFVENPKNQIQRSKLIHVLINILKNAKETMWEVPVDERNLYISVFTDDEASYIKLTDSGKGIPQADLSQIFNHGFTTKENGHGFGLHSCANYMTEMNGEIWAESEGKNKGATFYLKFPFKNGEPKKRAHSPQLVEASRLRHGSFATTDG